MTRRLLPGRLVLATHNPGKVREIGALVAPFGIEPVSAAELGLAVPDETGTTFAANAAIKALAQARAAGMVALADDSGLGVDALGGAPGVCSADWAEAPGRPRDFGVAMARVHAELTALHAPPPWRARFTCALALAWPDGHVQTYAGEVHGRLVWPPRGAQGFGYDAMFVADGMDATFGEIAPEHKHRVSHRAAAFARLMADALA